MSTTDYEDNDFEDDFDDKFDDDSTESEEVTN